MESPAQNAQGIGIAQAYGEGATAAVTITGLTPEQLQQALRAAGTAAQAVIDDLSDQLRTTHEAIRGFFSILSTNEIPTDKLPRMLEEIAQRQRNILKHLAALEVPETKSYIEEAVAILGNADTREAYERADKLLAEAEAAEMRAAWAAEALERDVKEAANKKRLSAAATRAERGELSLMQLDYMQAGQHFKAAAELVTHNELALRADYLNRYANALCDYGALRADNTLLAMAVGVYRSLLAEISRPELPLIWATTQNNLGNALWKLGERESGTARLEEAMTAIELAHGVYHAATPPQYETSFEERLQSLRQLIALRRRSHLTT